MAQYQAFKRVTVQPQTAQRMETVTFPAPTRGLSLDENETYMKPGGALVMDNWLPTLQGAALRGGFIEWCTLPETTPIISAFEYASRSERRIYFANATKVYDVTGGAPVEIANTRTSGNYVASQLANADGDHMIVLNDAGDFPLFFDGNTTTWSVLSGDQITGPPGSAVEHGRNLVYVCKFKNRWFFIELNSMNAWYLGINSVGGALSMIPLSGAASKGGKLIFCAVWSLDAGDGADDKLVFCTDLGELIIFTGSNPADPANWRQEGRFEMSPPLGMNAHIQVGGDLLVATVDGILPTSAAISKSRAELGLAALTRPIRRMWREEMLTKRNHPWTFCKWDEYGAMFVAMPGAPAGKHRTLLVNLESIAWARFTGWDCSCFARMRGDMFFGTQDGRVMQADRTGYDNGKPFVATIVGGWELFQSPSQTNVWRQARASFKARANQPFQPQLSATVDYVVVIPPPPLAGPDPGELDVWDEGKWDDAIWDAAAPPAPTIRNTGWVSIGMTGFSHAPIVQVYVAQQSKPDVELISIAATFERAGVNV